MNVTMLDDEDPEQVAYLGSVLTDDVPDLGMEGTGMEEAVQLICSRIPASERKMKFWEVYVDEGNLSAFLNWKDGVEARVFSLPDWNFEHRAEQIRFLDEMDKEQTGISLWGPYRQPLPLPGGRQRVATLMTLDPNTLVMNEIRSRTPSSRRLRQWHFTKPMLIWP